MTNHNYYEYYTNQQKLLIGSPSNIGRIQWKGTDVCIDVICACGEKMHFDTDFLYYIRCKKCDALYAVGDTVVLIPLEGEHRDYVEKDCHSSCVHTDEGDR